MLLVLLGVFSVDRSAICYFSLFEFSPHPRRTFRIKIPSIFGVPKPLISIESMCANRFRTNRGSSSETKKNLHNLPDRKLNTLHNGCGFAGSSRLETAQPWQSDWFNQSVKDEGRIEVLRENRDHYHVFAFVDGARPREEFIGAVLGGVRPTKVAELRTPTPAPARNARYAKEAHHSRKASIKKSARSKPWTSRTKKRR